MKANVPASRVHAIDILRGAIMILMAIDHVRVYSGLPAGGPSYGIFFTRWITHFCAPGFVFLAGVSALLYGARINNMRKLAGYLITRGLLLVILELTLIRFSWTFNFNYSQFALAGVIWMLGWCMVLLAAFIWLRPVVAGIAGIIIIVFQQLFQYVPQLLPGGPHNQFAMLWEFIYPSGFEGVHFMNILYVLVPWIGVMAAGYGFGTIILKEPGKRNKYCRIIGLAMITLFVIIGSIIIAKEDPSSESPPFLLRLLNQRKYPASPLYLLMTLGPLITLMPWAEKAKGWFVQVLPIFGKVPFFYYLLHIPLIHISALLFNYVVNGSINHEWYTTAPYASVPSENQWNLGMLYLIFLADVVILYFACRWYGKFKFNHPEKKWLKYI